MAPRKRASPSDISEEPIAKRRSSRLSSNNPASQAQPAERQQKDAVLKSKDDQEDLEQLAMEPQPVQKEKKKKAKNVERASSARPGSSAATEPPTKKPPSGAKPEEAKGRAGFDDPASLPDRNPDAARHDGEWYWLMKAEPETRLENGIDVRFSIDDLRAKTEPEPWDGIRNYGARNHMRNMNFGDKAFFYHSNCKEPGIVGIMEIVKEYSEDKTALQPGTPYYDPKSSAAAPKWSLVHVTFRKKFAVPILLSEIRALSSSKDSPLAEMQLVKQGRLSVNRIQQREWDFLCDLADKKAKDAGLEHEV